MKPKLVNIYKFHLCPTLLRRRESNPDLSALWPTTLPTWLSNYPTSQEKKEKNTATKDSTTPQVSQNVTRLIVILYAEYLSVYAIFPFIFLYDLPKMHYSLHRTKNKQKTVKHKMYDLRY